MAAPAPGMRVVVTRPLDESGPWIEGLRAAGCVPLALPLIDIVMLPPASDPVSVEGLRAVMWVSGNAVRGLLAGRQAPWPAGVRCWAPGPGTAAALRAAGVPDHLIDRPVDEAPQFDSEALWAVVAPQLRAGDAVLVVRGRSGPTAGDARASSGRDWLIRQCEAAGARVSALAVYERRCPVWDDATRRAAAVAAADGSVWLFSSGEAATHLPRLLPGQDWARTPALATHPRIAEALAGVGFRHIRTVRPTLTAVYDALRDLRASAGA
ncbi:uroporphyrinogen-III synthase [Hydrogenophaga sp. OTU3427]|uniref:uroporphyrinogen-III synthase n=1 Tax=Hydrogenophaga sp. OTU3427 TaxID=3043856 RepID=UPI00313CC2B6